MVAIHREMYIGFNGAVGKGKLYSTAFGAFAGGKDDVLSLTVLIHYKKVESRLAFVVGFERFDGVGDVKFVFDIDCFSANFNRLREIVGARFGKTGRK